jgi:predicted MFS family arabinose efflux permease
MILMSLGITFIMPRPEEHSRAFYNGGGRKLPRLLADPKYMLVALITIIFGGGFGVIITYLPNFIRTATDYKFSYFFILYIFVLIIIRFTFMRIVNSLNRVKLIMTVFAAGVLMNVSLNFLHSVIIFLIAGILYGITHGVLYPLLNATMVGLVKPEDRDRANAHYTAFFNFGMMMFAFSLGFLIDYFNSYLAAFNVCAAAGAAAIFLIYFVTRRFGGLDLKMQNEKVPAFEKN